MRKLSTDLIKSGSFLGSFSGSFSGSVIGNANTSTTASFALTSNLSDTASFSNLSFTSISSSFALSSSYAPNLGVGIVTGSGVLVTDAFDDVTSKNVYNNIITTFKTQENESLSRYNLIDGFIDDFTDSNGIFKSSSFFFSPSGSYGSKGYFTNELPLGDFYYNNDLLLMHFSGSDSSSSSFDSGPLNTTVGWFGDATITSSEYKFGSSSLFVGGTGYITASSLSLGTDYTIEFWAKSTVSSYLYSKFLFNLGNVGSFSQVTANTVSWNLIPSTITVPNINNWNHYAFTRKNNIANIFLNGVLQASASNSSSVSNSTLYVGRGLSTSPTTYWSGFYDEFRVTANTARYNGPSFATQSIELYNNLGSDPTGSAYSSSLILNYQSCSTNIQNVNVVVLAEPLSSSFSLNNNFNLYVSKDSGSTYYVSPLVYQSVYSSSILIYTSTLALSSYGTSSILALGISSSVSPLRIYGVGVVSTTSNRNNILATSGIVGINYSSLFGNGLSSSFNVSDSSFNSSNTIVFLTGSVLSPTTDFSLSDGNLVLTNPVPNNEKVSLLKFTSLLTESNPNTAVMDYQNISATLSQSVLTLSQNVTVPKNLIVSINGLIKNLNDDYSISGSKFLVLNKPPASLDNISIRYVNTIANADILSQRYVSNGISSSYSLSSSLNTVNSLLISVNGILQTPLLHYYINSSSLYDSAVLDEAPKSGSIIEIRKIQYASPYSTLTSSFSTTASYALNADIYLTASNVNQSIAYSVSQSQEFVVTTAQLTSNYWSANIIEEWDSGSFVLDSNYSNVKLLLHFSGSNRSSGFIDNSLNNYTASISGSPVISTNESKFNNSSLFLSNNSFLYYSQSLLPLSSNFTVESWVQPISYVNQPAIWSQGNGFPFGANRLQLYLNTSGNVIVQYGAANIITSSLLVPLSKWTNITFVKSSSVQYLFIDGTLTNTSSISTLETAAFIIGNNYSLGSQYFNGYIDEFRITNSARYSSSFTVSDIEFPNANTVSQSAAKYFASIGGLNDSYADYGVEKLSDTSIKVKKLSRTTQPLSGSSYLNPITDRVYVNIIDNTKALVQTLTAVYASTANSASYANTASYASYATYTQTSSFTTFSSSISITSSISSSYAVTASYALNSGNVSGGTTNTIAKFSGATTLATSSIADDGTTVTIAAASSIKGVKETYTSVTPSAGVVTVDLNTTTVALLTLNASVTSFTINNLTAGKVNSFTIITIPNGGVYTITWTFGGVGVKWPSGTAPTLTTTNAKYDIFSFVYDGTNWYGLTGGQNF